MNEMFWVIMIIENVRRHYNIPPKIFYHGKTYFSSVLEICAKICLQSVQYYGIIHCYFRKAAAKNMFTIIV